MLTDNPDYSAMYREDNREKLRAANKLYRDNNKEKIREKNRAYRAANKDKIKERDLMYREKNKAKVKESQKNYWSTHSYSEYMSNYYRENKEILALKYKHYRVINRDKRREYDKNMREKLPLNYVACKHNLPKPTTEGEIALLEILRYNTLTKRLIKEAK